jgi:hypothetical protein
VLKDFQACYAVFHASIWNTLLDGDGSDDELVDFAIQLHERGGGEGVEELALVVGDGKLLSV